MKNIILLGSTGSLGRQVLEVIDQNKDKFKIIGLSANKNLGLLKKQVEKFKPKMVATSEKELNKLAGLKVQAILVNCLSGSVGLVPTLTAIRSGKNVIMANKESMVIAGDQILKEAKKHRVSILPLDSEHTSIFQILRGIKKEEIEKVVLTCSGGAFLGKKKNDLKCVTLREVLKHPTWKMGKKITVDCATLVNKGLEIIEAQRFFNLKPEQIDVIIHPESLAHCLIYLKNGVVLAVIHQNDMRIPINYILNYPNEANWPNNLIWEKLTFLKPDLKTFEGLKIGFEVMKKSGVYPAIYTLANEVAVEKFLAGKIKFLEIAGIIKRNLKNKKLREFLEKNLIKDFRPEELNQYREFI